MDSSPYPHHSRSVVERTSIDSSEETETSQHSPSPVKQTMSAIESTIPTLEPTPEKSVVQLIEPARSDGVELRKRWKQFNTLLLLFSVTFIWVVSTITYTILSSASRPVGIFSRPEQTIFALNLLANLSVFFLGELVGGALEVIRWTLASRSSGLGLATFIGLGRATSLFGVFRLFVSDQQVGHRKWCGQR